MPQSRQLAAIMFTDIVGYTELMGDDEDKAFDLLNKNRLLHKPIIERYRGKWIKELGDGVLATFTTVTDAVLCACSIIKGCESIEGLQLRIGIHQSEVVFENNDVFGDGVNIASRLQALAPIGGICISEAVRNNVANRKEIQTRFIKEEMLKHVKEPVRIYEVIVDCADPITQYPTKVADKEPTHILIEKSIAVLPFVNMSNDPDQEYFSDGMSEEILNSLSHLKNLKVAGRTSSFQFKTKNIDMREIGEKLGVKNVLEGSVRRQGNRLRITAQLINVEDGFHLWSEKYDRDMDDIFAIQDEIALSITEQLKITLLDKEKEIIFQTPTENKKAYDLYLKGRFYWNRRGPGLKKGLEYFLHSAELDPDFSLAHAGIADTYALFAFYSILPPHQVVPKAKQAAEKAIHSNPALVEPYALQAFLTTFYDRNWTEAKKQFEGAIAINPGYAPAHYWYSNYLSWVHKDYLHSEEEALNAIELEPLTSHSHNTLASVYLCSGKFEEARKASQTAIDLDANTFISYSCLSTSLFGLGKYEEAIEVSKHAVNISARHQYPLLELSWLYHKTNNIPEAQKILDELILRSKTEFISALSLSVAAYASKNYDMAFEFLEQAFEERASFLVTIGVYPFFSFIKTDPRFQPFFKRMNFPG
jgi:TolB-like protein/Tfp pilus assembly protein PilF